MKVTKKLLTAVLSAAIALSSVTVANAATSPSEANEPVTESNVSTDDSATVKKVSTSDDGTATVKKVANKKSVKISSTVTVDGVTYKVTAIGANAFKKAKKVKKVTLPASIKSVKKKAFTGAKKLKKIIIKGKKTKFAKGAFKGLNTKKITIKVPKAKLKAYKKALKKAGFKGKVKKA